MHPHVHLRSMLCILASSLLVVGAHAGSSAEIYPSGRQIPENLRFFEVRLPKALHRPVDLSHVTLQDSDGRPIQSAFVDAPLTAEDGRHFTLFLHSDDGTASASPAGTSGRTLRAGKSVTLVINDPGVGRPLRKTWRVAASDESRPSPENWTFKVPRAGTRQALLVRLKSPISAASQSQIAVMGAENQRLSGRVVLSDGETTWCFIPSRTWMAGPYSIVALPDLMSVAGNRNCAIARAGKSEANCEAKQSRAFEIKPR